MTSRSRASTALSTLPLFRYSATESLSLRLSTAGLGIAITSSIAPPPTASALAQAHVAPDQLHRARIGYLRSDTEYALIQQSPGAPGVDSALICQATGRNPRRASRPRRETTPSSSEQDPSIRQC